MPDLITHYTIAHLAVRLRWRPAIMLFLLGALLPDVVTRPVHIIWPQAYWLVMPLHTPVGIVIVSWMVAALFRTQDRRVVFVAHVLSRLGDLSFARSSGSIALFSRLPLTARRIEWKMRCSSVVFNLRSL